MYTEHSPGEPLNIADMPGNQGIAQYQFVPVYTTIPSAGYPGGYRSFFQTAMPVVSATFSSQNIPFQPMKTDYQP